MKKIFPRLRPVWSFFRCLRSRTRCSRHTENSFTLSSPCSWAPPSNSPSPFFCSGVPESHCTGLSPGQSAATLSHRWSISSSSIASAGCFLRYWSGCWLRPAPPPYRSVCRPVCIRFCPIFCPCDWSCLSVSSLRRVCTTFSASFSALLIPKNYQKMVYCSINPQFNTQNDYKIKKYLFFC